MKPNLNCIMRKKDSCLCETKGTDQLCSNCTVSCAVTARLISTFVFPIRIVQILFFLNPKFQDSSHLLWLHGLLCVRPGRKPRSFLALKLIYYCPLSHVTKWSALIEICNDWRTAYSMAVNSLLSIDSQTIRLSITTLHFAV